MPKPKPVTYVAVTPDGTRMTKNSSARVYTHARWIKFPGDDHQVIASWHMSEHTARTSPFQSTVWKEFPHGVVEVVRDGDAPQQVRDADPVADAAPVAPVVADTPQDTSAPTAVAVPLETVGMTTVAGWFGSKNRATVHNWINRYPNTPTPDGYHEGQPGWTLDREPEWRRWYDTEGPGRPAHLKPSHTNRHLRAVDTGTVPVTDRLPTPDEVAANPAAYSPGLAMVAAVHLAVDAHERETASRRRTASRALERRRAAAKIQNPNTTATKGK